MCWCWPRMRTGAMGSARAARGPTSPARRRRARGLSWSGISGSVSHASAYTAGDLATAMSALSDTLLDEVTLLGSPSRIREGIERLAGAGVEWITLGPQAVAPESLAQQAERMIATLAPR